MSALSRVLLLGVLLVGVGLGIFWLLDPDRFALLVTQIENQLGIEQATQSPSQTGQQSTSPPAVQPPLSGESNGAANQFVDWCLIPAHQQATAEANEKAVSSCRCIGDVMRTYWSADQMRGFVCAYKVLTSPTTATTQMEVAACRSKYHLQQDELQNLISLTTTKCLAGPGVQ